LWGSDLAALAGALPPERDGVALLADGDALDSGDRDRVFATMFGLGFQLLEGVRVVMRSADVGGALCLAQVLSDRLNVRLFAATTESIAQALGGPDGRVRPAALVWQRYLPRAHSLTDGTTAA